MHKEILSRENHKLANTIILFSDWLFYIDSRMNIYPRISRYDNSFCIGRQNHNHWWGNEGKEVEVLATNVEEHEADRASDEFMHLAYKSDIIFRN